MIAIVLAILAPFFALMVQMAISRHREYLADASGVELTRNPLGLAHALQKIAGDPRSLRVATRATAHLYIANPLKGKKTKESAGLFDTHPPIQKRIDILLPMAHAGPDALPAAQDGAPHVAPGPDAGSAELELSAQRRHGCLRGDDEVDRLDQARNVAGRRPRRPSLARLEAVVERAAVVGVVGGHGQGQARRPTGAAARRPGAAGSAPARSERSRWRERGRRSSSNSRAALSKRPRA